MENSKKLELKVQALLEKISSLTMDYENQVANLRVEITSLADELQRTRDELSQTQVLQDTGGESEVSQEDTSNEG